MAFQKYNLRKESNGAPVESLRGVEAASQTFVKGDFLTLSSGKLAIAVAASGTYTSGDLESATIIGTADADATGVTDTPLTYTPLTDNTLHLLPILHGTPASAVSAVAQLGVGYDLGHYTLNGVTVWGVMIDDTSVKNVIPMALQDTVGTQYGTVWAKFANRARLDMVGA